MSPPSSVLRRGNLFVYVGTALALLLFLCTAHTAWRLHWRSRRLRLRRAEVAAALGMLGELSQVPRL